MAESAQLGDQNTRILEFLHGELGREPDGIDPVKYKAAVDYTIRRYRVGLAHYAAIFERLGFAGLRNGLDIGCGGGQWCMAFLYQNEHVTGIEPRPEFVEVGRRVAVELGLAARTAYRAERAEGMTLTSNSFDAAWSHSVLYYTDQERIIANVVNALRPGAPFYCAYTTEGYRLHDIEFAFKRGNDALLNSCLSTLVSGYLHRCGISRTPGNQTRLLTAEDLLRTCRVLGLECVGRPGVQDGLTDYRGLDATFDFVVRKTADPTLVKQRLCAGEAVETGWLDDLERIALSGAPALVCDVFEAVDPDPGDDARRAVYARALILARRTETPSGRRIFVEGKAPSSHVTGLRRHDERDYAGALAAYHQMPESQADKSFLIGACLLHLRQFAAARDHFAAEVDGGMVARRERIGLVAAHYALGERSQAAAAFNELLELNL